MDEESFQLAFFFLALPLHRIGLTTGKRALAFKGFRIHTNTKVHINNCNAGDTERAETFK
jgi:hypothetical protein